MNFYFRRGKNYTATGGAAAVQGVKTGKILFSDLRQRMCSMCAWHLRKAGDNAVPKTPDHDCYLNWAGSSPAMEGDIISKV